ncbi:MAG TPA: hypothetical protein VEV20_11620 [Burkholderiales bacterium]|nr:hypothetical protein [Burkholderiales bacterium]
MTAGERSGGEGDNRLAIECDGDKFHGPDRWAQSMRRQRVLERAGWLALLCVDLDLAPGDGARGTLGAIGRDGYRSGRSAVSWRYACREKDLEIAKPSRRRPSRCRSASCDGGAIVPSDLPGLPD